MTAPHHVLPSQEQQAEAVLQTLRIEKTETNIEQMKVMLEAFGIFMVRNSRYVDEWKRTGWRGMLFEARKKISRVWQVFWNGRQEKVGDSQYDDVFDAINYMVFFIRQHREKGRPWGEWDDA
jgi:hypothetical protein